VRRLPVLSEPIELLCRLTQVIPNCIIKPGKRERVERPITIVARTSLKRATSIPAPRQVYRRAKNPEEGRVVGRNAGRQMSIFVSRLKITIETSSVRCILIGHSVTSQRHSVASTLYGQARAMQHFALSVFAVMVFLCAAPGQADAQAKHFNTNGGADSTQITLDERTCANYATPDQAIAACSRLLSNHGADRGHVLYQRGIQWIKKEYDRAIADLSECIRLAPSPPDGPLFLRGNNWFHMGEYQRAIVDYNAAIQLNPTSTMYYSGRADANRKLGRWASALDDMNAAIQLNPKSAGSYASRSLVWSESGDYSRAIADLTLAITLDPKNGQAYIMRGAAERMLGNLGNAVADQRRALLLTPTKEALTEYGNTLRYLGDYQAALADFRGLLTLDPNNVNALVGRALTYEKMGNLDLARADFDKALAVHGTDVPNLISSCETARSRLAALNSATPEPIILPLPATAKNPSSVPTYSLNLPAAITDSGSSADRRVALIVGNSRYQNVRALANSTNDARAVSETLKRIGFSQVVLAIDLTREKLLDALQAFASQAQNADWALIYYAGHGMEIEGRNYLLPIDSRFDGEHDPRSDALPLDQMMLAADGAKKIKLIILDACRDNPLEKDSRPLISNLGGALDNSSSALPKKLSFSRARSRRSKS
jgi:tetratricopeptide (TPR) repeat protein